MIERQTSENVKRFRSNSSLKFYNKDFNKLGIKHERSNLESPQMNSMAESANRTLLDLARSNAVLLSCHQNSGQKQLIQRPT